MNDIIREALESYKSLAEDMHDTVCQSFSDDIDLCIKALAALDAAPVKEPKDMILAPRGLIEAVAHHGVDTGYGVFKIESKHIQEARDLLTALSGTKEMK